MSQLPLSTIEFQIRRERAEEVLLEMLRAATFTLPEASERWQVQRVRMDRATFRFGDPAQFWVYWTAFGTRQSDDFTAPMTLLDIDVRIEVNQVTTIAASPNTMPAAEFAPQATLTLRIDAGVDGLGHANLYPSIEHADSPEATVLGISDPTGWVEQNLGQYLPLHALRLPFDVFLAAGVEFQNAGVAVSADQSFLAVSASAGNPDDPWRKWSAFRSGNIAAHLGDADWALVLQATELEHALQTVVWNALKDKLGWRLVTVEPHYIALGDTVRIHLIPWVHLPDPIGTVDIPVNVDITADAAKGTAHVDIDAYGIRDLANDATVILASVLTFAVPVLGSYLSGQIAQAIGALEWIGTIAAAGAVKAVQPVVVGDRPFHWTAEVPLPASPIAAGHITAVAPEPAQLDIRGSWSAAAPPLGDVQVAPGAFSWWLGPLTGCGGNEKALLERIAADPASVGRLQASIGVSMSTSQPARVTDVRIINSAALYPVPAVSMTSATLPTTITLDAPGTLAGTAPEVVVEVRTSQGVFHASVPIPPTPGADVVEQLSSLANLNRKWCDSLALPKWFQGDGPFDLGWIVDPLLDPDPDLGGRYIEIVHIDIDGARVGSIVQVAQGGITAQTTVRRDGRASLSFLAAPASEPPALTMQPPAVRRGRDVPWDTSGEGFQVQRHVLERVSSLSLPAPAVGVFAGRPGLAELAMADDQGVTLWGVSGGGLQEVGSWSIPGVVGVVSTRSGLLAAGSFGIRSLSVDGTLCGCGVLTDSPVRGLATYGDILYVASEGRLVAMTPSGHVLGDTESRGAVSGIVWDGEQLLVSSESGFTAWGWSRDEGFVQKYADDLPRDTRLVRSATSDEFLAVHGDGTTDVLSRTDDGPWTISSTEMTPWRTQLHDVGPALVRVDANEVSIYRRSATTRS